jgi:putative Holliday junction resolvase
MTAEFPLDGRLAGVDYGTVRIGVAISDPDRLLASPLENYSRGNTEVDAEHFRQLVAAERIVGFVVGLPVPNSGQESEKSLEAREFGAWLHRVTGLPVRFHDERFTSVQAGHYLAAAKVGRKGRKKRLDMLAAQIMLASYLESARHDGPGSLDD